MIKLVIRIQAVTKHATQARMGLKIAYELTCEGGSGRFPSGLLSMDSLVTE